MKILNNYFSLSVLLSFGFTGCTGPVIATPAEREVQLPCEAIVAAASAEGQGELTIPVELDLYIECEMRERQIPGVALEITRNDEILTERAYGLASIQNNAPVGEFGTGMNRK